MTPIQCGRTSATGAVCVYPYGHQSYHSWTVAKQPWYQRCYAWALRRSEKVSATPIGQATEKAAAKVIDPLVK